MVFDLIKKGLWYYLITEDKQIPSPILDIQELFKD